MFSLSESKLRIQEGKSDSLEFSARTRKNHWMGGEKKYPFTINVATETKPGSPISMQPPPQVHQGELVSKGKLASLVGCENFIMKIPSLPQAESYLLEAASLNPGPWVAHSRYAAKGASLIAEKVPGLDIETAMIFGLLHDIGRREDLLICGMPWMDFVLWKERVTLRLGVSA